MTSFFILRTRCFNNKKILFIIIRGNKIWLDSDKYLWEERDLYFLCQTNHINRTNLAESFARLDHSPILPPFSPPLRDNNAGVLNLGPSKPMTFGLLLPRTPARIWPGKEKRDQGAARRGQTGEKEGRGEREKKGGYALGQKGIEKNETHPADGVDRFVWSLIWSRESILLLFPPFLRSPSLPVPCPSSLVLFHFGRTPLAVPSRSFSLRF